MPFALHSIVDSSWGQTKCFRRRLISVLRLCIPCLLLMTIPVGSVPSPGQALALRPDALRYEALDAIEVGEDSSRRDWNRYPQGHASMTASNSKSIFHRRASDQLNIGSAPFIRQDLFPQGTCLRAFDSPAFALSYINRQKQLKRNLWSIHATGTDVAEFFLGEPTLTRSFSIPDSLENEIRHTVGNRTLFRVQYTFSPIFFLALMSAVVDKQTESLITKMQICDGLLTPALKTGFNNLDRNSFAPQDRLARLRNQLLVGSLTAPGHRRSFREVEWSAMTIAEVWALQALMQSEQASLWSAVGVVVTPLRSYAQRLTGPECRKLMNLVEAVERLAMKIHRAVTRELTLAGWLGRRHLLPGLQPAPENGLPMGTLQVLPSPGIQLRSG